LTVIVGALAALGVLLGFYATSGRSDRTLAECSTPTKNSEAGPLTKVQLQANRARPSLTVPLADGGDAFDEISFSPKKPISIPSEIQAYLIEYPRQGDQRSAAKITVAAAPAAGGTVAQLSVCVKRGDDWEAGTFQGTVRIFGGGIVAFDYPLIITERWPWEAAVGLLVLALAAFLLITIQSQSLTFKADQEHSTSASFLGLAIAVAAVTPTFFGTYWNNPTWGSNPGSQLSGLVVAGFTAAVAGLALADRLFAGK
jgi:hypothetical protein